MIEIFHLLFLRALNAKEQDKRVVAVKGGCNLRFYFASIRYSEDIDFDVRVIAKDTLTKKVDLVLKSPALTRPLAAKGIEVVNFSKPKQTETTQRWKIGLRAEGVAVELRTRIEFSRRSTIEGAVFEGTAREIMRPYGEPAILALHYAIAAAISQKVHALAKRAAPQARDVFDLNHLFARTDAEDVRLDAAQRSWISNAIEHATGISFDEYSSQVVAYLEPTQAEPFADLDAWKAMQATVLARLEALRERE